MQYSQQELLTELIQNIALMPAIFGVSQVEVWMGDVCIAKGQR